MSDILQLIEEEMQGVDKEYQELETNLRNSEDVVQRIKNAMEQKRGAWNHLSSLKEKQLARMANAVPVADEPPVVDEPPIEIRKAKA